MPDRPPLDRRSFLTLAGFSFALSVLPGCSSDEEFSAVPFLDKPEEVTPGRPTFFATLCGGCTAGCGILATNIDGRPIKVEGNPEHPLSRGRTCPVGQAMVLGLYDSHRLGQPLAKGSESTWDAVDVAVRSSLQEIKARGGKVRFLTGTVNGPTRRAAIDRFLAAFPGSRHVMADPLSSSALLDAHERVFGVRRFPSIHLERAEVIASFDADFLGPWISPVEHTRAYVDGRGLDDADALFSHHVQFESRVSLTGSNADRRVALRPDQIRPALEALGSALAAKAGRPTPWPTREHDAHLKGAVEDVARRLHEATRGRTLILCGTNDVEAQAIAAWINDSLGNYRFSAKHQDTQGTLDLARPTRQRMGDDKALKALIAEIRAGSVDALFVHGVNPVYDLPEGQELAEALKKIPLIVSFAEREDETAALAHYVCPDHHPLESWDDAEGRAGLLTLSQPALAPLRSTRAFVESLASFAGRPETALEIVRRTWRKDVLPRSGNTDFEAFWERSVHDGFVDLGDEGVKRPVTVRVSPDALRSLATPPKRPSGLQLVLHPNAGVLDGRHAHNPWLQELPDPITKIAWGNCVSLSPTTARELGAQDGDVLRIELPGGGGVHVEAPALIQPGQAENVVALALGYGRRGTDRFTNIGPNWIEGRPTVEPGHTVGVNAAPFRRWTRSGVADDRAGVQVTKTGRREDLARSQIYQSLDVPEKLASPGRRRRPLVHQATLGAWRVDPTSGGHPPHPFEELWDDDHPYEGHHWALAIDLSACTGCSACVVACQAENNIPVVGKDEVRRQRDMNWVRVDRYYQGEGADLDVRHQPMMCQQCDNAPCETVCPVLATVHSSEGLNQQVYNRCVGTRYCANNCPYKVRRFNWFDYSHEDPMANMVLNPAVTVRSRGVMEKCTFCVQRIEEARAQARREGRPIRDGDIDPACAQACPAGAMVFGDTNGEESRVQARLQDPRAYRVLDDLNVRPSVGYLTDVRDRDATEGGPAHG